MKAILALAAAVTCLVGVEARAQCATSCSTVAPKNPVILVHGRNDDATRWDALVASWSTRGYTEGVNLFRIDLARDCGSASFCSAVPGYTGTYVNETYGKCLAAFIDQKVPCVSGTCPAVDVVAHSQGTVVARGHERLEPARMDHHVGVEEHEVPAAGERGALVARRSEPLVAVVEDGPHVVALGQALRRAVGGPVVDDDDLVGERRVRGERRERQLGPAPAAVGDEDDRRDGLRPRHRHVRRRYTTRRSRAVCRTTRRLRAWVSSAPAR